MAIDLYRSRCANEIVWSHLQALLLHLHRLIHIVMGKKFQTEKLSKSSAIAFFSSFLEPLRTMLCRKNLQTQWPANTLCERVCSFRLRQESLLMIRIVNFALFHLYWTHFNWWHSYAHHIHNKCILRYALPSSHSVVPKADVVCSAAAIAIAASLLCTLTMYLILWPVVYVLHARNQRLLLFTASLHSTFEIISRKIDTAMHAIRCFVAVSCTNFATVYRFFFDQHLGNQKKRQIKQSIEEPNSSQDAISQSVRERFRLLNVNLTEFSVKWVCVCAYRNQNIPK